MGNKGIIVEIKAHEANGALFSSFLGRTRIERMESATIKDGETASDAVRKLLSSFPSDASVTLVLPGHLFMVRNVSLPFTDRKKIRKALPYKVDGLLPFPVEDVLIGSLLSAQTDTGSIIMSLAIPARLLEHYLEQFPVGRKPSKVIPDFVSLLSLGINIKGESGTYGVVEIEDGKTSMVFIQNGRPLLARSIAYAEGVSPVHDDIAASIKALPGEGQKVSRLYIAGTGAKIYFPPVDGVAEIAPMPAVIKGRGGVTLPLQEKPSWTSLVGGAMASVEYPWFNMLGLSSETEIFDKALRTLSIGAAILLAMGTGDLYLRSRVESQRYNSLKAETRKVFLSLMPEVKKVVREDVQLKDALNKQKGTLEALTGKPSPAYLAALKGTEKIIREHPEIKVREASFEGYGMTFSGDAAGTDAEGLKRLFSGIEGTVGVKVEEMVQGSDPNSYRFRIRAELKQ